MGGFCGLLAMALLFTSLGGGVSAARISLSTSAIDAHAVDNLTAAPNLPAWMLVFCKGGQVQSKPKDPDFFAACEAFEKKMRLPCDKIEEARSLGQVAMGKAEHEYKRQCDEYTTQKQKSEAQVAFDDAQGQIIKEARDACEPEVFSVCVQYACPTQNAIRRGQNSQPCLDTCESVVKSAFHTGEMECEEDEKWSDCQGRKLKELADSGRDVTLEALVREHTLKCICVSRPSNQEICYEGGLGLAKGQKWCEWHDTPSWRQLLSEADADTLGKLPKAKCNEFPLGNKSGAPNPSRAVALTLFSAFLLAWY